MGLGSNMFAGWERVKGWRQEFSDGGLTLPTRGLKYWFWGTFTTKNLRKIVFHLPTWRLA